VVRMTAGDHRHVDRPEAVEVDRALRAGDYHPVLEGILQDGVDEDSHRTRLDQNRGMSEKRDLHVCPARGKHSPTYSDRAAPVLCNTRPSPRLRGSFLSR
jgi:hypothetical protein